MRAFGGLLEAYDLRIYLDFNTLQRAADFNGLACELLFEGEHYDYLARLMLKR